MRMLLGPASRLLSARYGMPVFLAQGTTGTTVRPGGDGGLQALALQGRQPGPHDGRAQGGPCLHRPRFGRRGGRLDARPLRRPRRTKRLLKASPAAKAYGIT